jgi:hypothetical protein
MLQPRLLDAALLSNPEGRRRNAKPENAANSCVRAAQMAVVSTFSQKPFCLAALAEQLTLVPRKV